MLLDYGSVKMVLQLQNTLRFQLNSFVNKNTNPISFIFVHWHSFLHPCLPFILFIEDATTKFLFKVNEHFYWTITLVSCELHLFQDALIAKVLFYIDISVSVKSKSHLHYILFYITLDFYKGNWSNTENIAHINLSSHIQ